MESNTDNTGSSNMLLFGALIVGAIVVAGGGYWYFVLKPKSGSSSSSSSASVDGESDAVNGGKIDVGARPGATKILPGATATETVTPDKSEKLRGRGKFNDAISKRVSNNSYAGYEDYLPSDKYNQFWGAIRQFVTTTEPPASDVSMAGKIQKKKFDSDYSSAESKVRGFLKGMNLAMRPEYVADFKPFIEEYLKNPASLPHWNIGKAGLFIPGKY